jgi:serine/threonine-protein kinase SMG1
MSCKFSSKKITKFFFILVFFHDRDDIRNQLLLMKTHLNDLSSNRADILRLETQRIIRSKQISLVRELEALGSAMSSHPLNTLSQRYATYKKKRNDCEIIRSILREKVIQLENILEDYMNFRNDDKMLTQLNDVNNSNVEVSEFVLIKEFLENSNQGQLYVECEQLRNELNESLYRRKQVLKEMVQIVSQYEKIVEFYPQNHTENHRLKKFSFWFQHLIENNTSDSSKQIMTEFHSKFDDRNVDISGNITSVFFHLQTFLTKLSYQRDVCITNLHTLEKQTKNGNFDVFKQEFNEFLNRMESNQRNPILHDLYKLTKRMETVEVEIFNHNQEILGDLLINGRWHLNEVRIQMTFLNNLMDIITKTSTHPLLNDITKLFNILTESIDSLNSAQSTFCLDIIPLTLKSIVIEDKSTMDMISKLNSISKPELINILNQDLLNVNNEGIMRAESVFDDYKLMLEEYQNMSECLGKKVFLSIHKIFEDITQNSLNIASNTFKVPTEWINFVELEKARSIMFNLNPPLISTLKQIFMVERIKTMLEFFTICLEITLTLKGSGAILNLDPEFLCRPLKNFICNYYSRFILGRVSYCLSSIICCLYSDKNRLQSFDQIKMEFPANKACEKYFMQLEENLRTEEAIEYSRNSAETREKYIKVINGLLNSLQWLHEDKLQMNSTTFPQMPRHSLLIQLQNRIQTLSSWKTSIAKIDDELKLCTVAVLQRLKWAAGANPLVNESLKNFETISNMKAITLEDDKKLADIVMRNCCAILNYELMRFKTPNTILSDEDFIALVKRWEIVNIAMKNVSNTLNPIEESLVELLDPEGIIDKDWIEKVTSLIDDIIHKAHGDIDSKEKNVAIARDKLDVCAHKLRNFIATHHRLSTDVKNLLKSILNKQQQDESEQVKALRDYLDKYKTFMENITELHGNVLSKDFTDTLVKRTILLVDDSLTVITDIFSELFKFEKTISSVVLREHEKIEEFPPSPLNKKGKKKSTFLID